MTEWQGEVSGQSPRQMRKGRTKDRLAEKPLCQRVPLRNVELPGRDKGSLGDVDGPDSLGSELRGGETRGEAVVDDNDVLSSGPSRAQYTV